MQFYLWKKKNIKYDYVVELMITNPLKNCHDIDKTINKLVKTNADSVIAVSRVYEQHPRRLKKIINDRIVDIMPEEKESRRQDLEPYIYIRAGSIYAIKRDILIKKGLRYGTKNSRPYVLPYERSLNIDGERDFFIAEKILK